MYRSAHHRGAFEIVEEIWRSNSEQTIADCSDILTN
jgi:hypothetical protein